MADADPGHGSIAFKAFACPFEMVKSEAGAAVYRFARAECAKRIAGHYLHKAVLVSGFPLMLRLGVGKAKIERSTIINAGIDPERIERSFWMVCINPPVEFGRQMTIEGVRRVNSSALCFVSWKIKKAFHKERLD